MRFFSEQYAIRRLKNTNTALTESLLRTHPTARRRVSGDISLSVPSIGDSVLGCYFFLTWRNIP